MQSDPSFLTRPELPEPLSQEIEQYQVYSRREMLTIFQGMIETRAFVTIYFNQGDQFIVTNLLNVNPEFEEMVFDVGGDDTANQQLLTANRLIFVCFVEHIKIQFNSNRAELTQYENKPAFRVRMPDSLLRLQRRNYYRVPLPRMRNLTCQIPRPDAAGQMLEVNLLDLSVGGIAMMLLPNDLRLEAGMVLQNCKIDIPDFGMITAALEIRHIRADEDHHDSKRVGCQFVGVPGPMLNVLQRYINQVDRERRQHT